MCAIFFFKINLRTGYHQIIIIFEDISKTAFTIYNGHYEFLASLSFSLLAICLFLICLLNVSISTWINFIQKITTDLVKYEISMQPLGSWIPCKEYEPGQ